MPGYPELLREIVLLAVTAVGWTGNAGLGVTLEGDGDNHILHRQIRYVRGVFVASPRYVPGKSLLQKEKSHQDPASLGSANLTVQS